MSRFGYVILAMFPLACSSAATAADTSGHAHPAAADVAGKSEATVGYEKAMEVMHKDMTITYTNNADVDFVRGMIPHHQGAIDMAKVQLKYGKDPEIRRLCEGIIAAQEKEIAQMNAWLKAHAK